MDTVEIIALTMGTAWASGINLYATIFMLGILGGNGYVELPPDLEILTDPFVLITAGIMYCVEFFADKTPGVDTAWDSLHTFIRIPAGAVLAMGAVGQTDPALELGAFLLGGGLAAGAHASKAGSRVLINTSPEPFTNWTASITEDVLVVGGIWTALNYPWLFLIGLLVFISLMVWMLPKIWRAIKTLATKVRSFFSSSKPQQSSPMLAEAAKPTHDS